MIVIDGKAHRNMPEQVAKNQKDIEDIFKTLDGLNIQDNVVAIVDLSHLLTQDELEIVERAVAFIVYNDHLFIKRDQDGTNAYFDIVFSISGTTVISFNSDEMQVNLTTGALTLVSNTFATYSKTELDTLLGAKASITYVDTQLALKANLSGANFTGAITAPSIIENMSGYSFTKRNDEQDWTPIYVGIVKNGNKLTIVIFGSFTYDSGTSYANIANIIVPASVAAKLYPFTVGGSTRVLANKKIECLDTDSLGALTDITMLTQKYDDLITFQLRDMTSLTANKTYLFRIEQTFLLSDNLAA